MKLPNSVVINFYQFSHSFHAIFEKAILVKETVCLTAHKSKFIKIFC